MSWGRCFTRILGTDVLPLLDDWSDWNVREGNVPRLATRIHVRCKNDVDGHVYM